MFIDNNDSLILPTMVYQWFSNKNHCSIEINKYEVGRFNSYNRKSLSNDYSNDFIIV